jgi:gas vesicle protein
MEASVDWWQRFLRKKYQKTPYWMFQKGVKFHQEKEEKKIKITAETISEYCRFYQKDPKQIKDAIKFYPEEMQKEMNDFQKMMKELK